MKNPFILLSTAILPIFILVVSFTLYSGKTEISGIALDKQNKPVSGVRISLKQNGNEKHSGTSDTKGNYTIQNIAPGNYKCVVNFKDYTPSNLNLSIKQGSLNEINITLDSKSKSISITKIPIKEPIEISIVEDDMEISEEVFSFSAGKSASQASSSYYNSDFNTEEYNYISENGYKTPLQDPLSTFSIDADGASYANTRRFLKQGMLPPIDAVRIEEFINYFQYNYSEPSSNQPFSINTELAKCPWNEDHLLMHIGLKGMEKDKSEIPKSNLVFLLDVSGSMSAANKLGLVKKSLKMLVNQLGDNDRIAIVVYAGSSGLVLPSTKVENKQKILEVLENLQSGGSTAGAEGIELAYNVAEENFIKNGNNRVILCTDGDFNVGISSQSELIRLIEEKRESGVFLSLFGFGMGNLKDSKMEQLANHGNGTYNYIDNLSEAQKLFVNEAGSTLFTIAKDVKIQVEFNPAVVGAYRLIGYENRLLNKEDFNDDTKDAGEIGAGHTITAIYEIVPKGKPLPEISEIDDLKYQNVEESSMNTSDLATVKIRYKNPKEDISNLIEKEVSKDFIDFNSSSSNMKFSAAVAGWGMLLRNSEYKGSCSYENILKWGQSGRGADPFGYRGEFIQLIHLSKELDKREL